MRLVPLFLVAVVAAACGGSHSPSVRFEAHGVSVELPQGWRHADVSLTPHLRDPREVLAVGTFPLRYRPTACAQVAGSALEDLGPKDALVVLEERGLDPSSSWPDFPPRPKNFGPALGGPSEASACVPRARFSDHFFGFTADGRHFHAEVAFGPKASNATKTEAWTILDGMTVDPKVRPDWRSSG
jgi:hypothetical protein